MCRLVDADPETDLINLIAWLSDHPNKRIDELLPANWRAARRGGLPAGESSPKLVYPRSAAS